MEEEKSDTNKDGTGPDAVRLTEPEMHDDIHKSATNKDDTGTKAGLPDAVRLTELKMHDDIHKDLESGKAIGYECEPTKENILKWLRLYEDITSTNLSIYTSVGQSAAKPFLVYRANARCHHNVPDRSAPRKASEKDVGCPWRLVLTAKKADLRNKKTKNPLFGCGLVVKATGTHNHPTTSSAALKHLRVSEETEERLKELLRSNHAPSSALRSLDNQLADLHGDAYPMVAADRSKLPSLDYVYRLYYKLFGERYGEGGEKKMNERLSAIAEREDTRIDTSDGDIIVAVVSALMARSHTLQDSGEIVFVDSGTNMDRKMSHVFLFMSTGLAGGLPLGVIITSSESEAVLKRAFRLLQEMLPDGAFGGRGRDRGPALFMTDDSRTERRALQTVWEESTLLLCCFHVLQAAWRWLNDGKHAIRKEDRPTLMRRIKAMVYAPTSAALDAAMDEFESEAFMYPHLVDHIQSLYTRRAEWALCARHDLPNRGNNTNNVVEAAMRIVKDNVLNRTRAFDVIQLHDYMAGDLSSFYERKLIAVANGRRKPHRRESPDAGLVDDADISCPSEGDGLYLVRSSTEPAHQHRVDPVIGACSCPGNMKTGHCKHLSAVNKLLGLTLARTASAAEKKKMMFVATGQCMPDDWYTELTTCREGEDAVLPTAGQTDDNRAVQEAAPAGDEAGTPGAGLDVGAGASGDSSEAAAQALQLAHAVGERLVEDVTAALHKHPDQGPTWVKALGAFLKDWTAGSNSARVSQLYAQRGLTGKNKTNIPVMRPERRSACPLRGRRRVAGGRPPKDARRDHPYSRERGERAQPAPHSLQLCVDMNRALGR